MQTYVLYFWLDKYSVKVSGARCPNTSLDKKLMESMEVSQWVKRALC